MNPVTPVFSITLLTVVCSFKSPVVSTGTVAHDRHPVNVTDTSNEQVFFNAIYHKYPDDYFPLGSGTIFLETYSAETQKLKWTFSFFVMDSTKSGAAQYLNETKKPSLEKYLPHTHFYSGIHSHHYELGGSVGFAGFVHKGQAGFITGENETGLNESLNGIIKQAVIPGTSEKEKFCEAVLDAVTSGLTYSPYNKQTSFETKLSWNKNELTACKNSTGETQNRSSVTIRFVFDGDHISNIELDR